MMSEFAPNLAERIIEEYESRVDASESEAIADAANWQASQETDQ